MQPQAVSVQSPQLQQPQQSQITTSTSLAVAASLQISQFEQENASDPLLSSILEEVFSMQQELNLDSVVVPVSISQSTAVVSSSDDTMLLNMLDEFCEPTPPTLATPATPTTPVDFNEKLAISAIQKQLMSFEASTPTSPSTPSTPSNSFANSFPHPPSQPPPAYQANFVQNPSQPQTLVRARIPVPLQQRPQQQFVGIQRQMVSSVAISPGQVGQIRTRAPLSQPMNQPDLRTSLSQQRKLLDNCQQQKLLEVHHKRLLAQQQQQSIPQTQQQDSQVAIKSN